MTKRSLDSGIFIIENVLIFGYYLSGSQTPSYLNKSTTTAWVNKTYCPQHKSSQPSANFRSMEQG